MALPLGESLKANSGKKKEGAMRFSQQDLVPSLNSFPLEMPPNVMELEHTLAQESSKNNNAKKKHRTEQLAVQKRVQNKEVANKDAKVKIARIKLDVNQEGSRNGSEGKAVQMKDQRIVKKEVPSSKAEPLQESLQKHYATYKDRALESLRESQGRGEDDLPNSPRIGKDIKAADAISYNNLSISLSPLVLSKLRQEGFQEDEADVHPGDTQEHEEQELVSASTWIQQEQRSPPKVFS